MTKKLISGNEAVAYGALAAGVKTVAGYPGTPSTEMIDSLLKMDIEGTHVEWSTNEKVAFEVAAGGALLGYRTMCAMKMTGVNVAYDSLISIAYSGCTGGLVVYVVDDPGVSAGMSEQDSRGFALLSDMPVLEPSNLQESYDMAKYAFELAEAIQGPVFLRSVTSISQSHGLVEIEERILPETDHPLFEHNMEKYTKAGAVICMNQHKALIERLDAAGKYIAESSLNSLCLKTSKGVGVISVGVGNSYIDEAFDILEENQIKTDDISVLKLHNTLPYPDDEINAVLKHCTRVLVAEELEPYLENRVYLNAYKLGVKVDILGKNDGTYSRIGYYDADNLVNGICKLLNTALPALPENTDTAPEKKCAARPITVCAGCPHRGTYISIQNAISKLKMKKSEVVVTGDIGCTILGTTPPFNALWTEVSMGASIPLAQGLVYGGTKNPVLATIGDSTFFHAGMAGLVNALQHNANLTVIIMDNGWTSMTGMQINPGTAQDFQLGSWKQLDLKKVVEGLGVEDFHVIDPYDLDTTARAIAESMQYQGVSVILARRECAIQSNRRKIKYSAIKLDLEKCVNCKQCINITGCPAIAFADNTISIDYAQCNGCGICTQVCKFDALVKEQ
ncbi:thiamine pyrophosphate-dependent enzyme [Pectinatus haikarae]|uniref:Indolepyruvate oxidoreductase subunit IorA n=1 Tax=Pectinatus haikarae TaxID=349096 RepID=A0ABT9YAB2_9FIRM|nr:thiamine pyrophosphate-dependent enzyme [Pectinatus haikarae]MDQ0204783.1 indolepyruvate ferredoxin oxidoreductase alpha subunit [Pectinatus haikarae]